MNTRIFFHSLIALAALWLAATPALPAENPAGLPPADDKITLPAALAEALARSPALHVIEADIDAARGGVRTAGARPGLDLTFAPGLKHVREADGSHNEFKGTLALSRTFTFPGRRDLLVAIAGRNVELRQLALDGLRFQVGAAVRRAFTELLAAQGILGLRQLQLESAQTFQQAAARRAESGYASDFEAVKSQGDVINARKLLQAAENQIAGARVDLNLLLGREPSAPLEAVGALDGTGPTRATADLVALAQAVNPGLRVQVLQAEIAGLNLRQARLARKSDITVGPSLEYSKSEQVLGFSATLALPDKSYGQGEILTATAEQRKVQAETAQLRREITGAVARAATQWAGARAQLALYSPAYLDQLKAVVVQAEHSYAQNATSLLIYLDAKRTYFDTLADYHEAIAQAATSRAELESAVGAPLQ